SVKKPNSRLFNWSLKLSQYSFDIKYQSGKTNVEADCLSRSPIDRIENDSHIKIVNLISKQDLIIEQNNAIENKEAIPKRCKKENDLIVRVKNNFHKAFIPEKLRKNLIEKFHLDFGHLGAGKMQKLMSTCYFWPNLSKNISTFVNCCKVCQSNKLSRRKTLGSLSQIGPAKEPFEIISIDTIGGFSGYNSSKQYIHVAIDNFTRFAWCIASKTQSAKDFINLIKSVSSINKPKLIVADRYTGIKEVTIRTDNKYYPEINEARKIAFQNSKINREYNKNLYDKKHDPITLKE
ncbi:Retrotransposable element Tf2 protein type 1-like protein, partial [Dinothrombium tinctorium]